MKSGTVRWIVPLMTAFVLCLGSAGWASAQVQNLLKDPGFEGEAYTLVDTAQDGTKFYVPAGWGGWYSQSPRDRGSWQNITPNGAPHTGGFRREGNRTLSISRGGATFTAAVYQQATVTAGANLRATAWALSRTSLSENRSCASESTPTVGRIPCDRRHLVAAQRQRPDVESGSGRCDGDCGHSDGFFTRLRSGPDPNSVYWDDLSRWSSAVAGAVRQSSH
jgi:hypothetical protein